jgi:hypothetical protein
MQTITYHLMYLVLTQYSSSNNKPTASISNKAISFSQNKSGLLGTTRQATSSNLNSTHLSPPAPESKGMAKLNVGAGKQGILLHEAQVWTQNTEQLLAT